MADEQQFRAALLDSIKLVDRGETREAFKIIDDAVAEAKRRQPLWVTNLLHHAAHLARFAGDLELAKSYYERSLDHDPENPKALYGLAYIARERGEDKSANELAKRCYQAIVLSDDEIIKKGLLDLVLNNWPDAASR